MQNLLIVAASYVFYAWWDWRFLILIIASTFTDYFVGLNLGKQNDSPKRKLLLLISIIVNISFLFFFKYFNFFLENFVAAFSFFGKNIKPNTLNIILPVGISFYTFQTLSYTIDIYRGKLLPTKDIIAFSAFVGFFPQLVAGPIERAANLLPQFYVKRHFDIDNAVNGLKQILWGLFKKVVIADNAAEFVNLIFGQPEAFNGSTLLLGAIFFAFQIYGDFSGYSDIAIGTARLFGFNLMTNFSYPYFSRDIAEFWRRWHISLSTWFRDYVYIPLGGSRGGNIMRVRNTFVIFIVSGFWHGANWTFIIWGALNALYFLPLMLTNKNRNHINIAAKGKILPNIREIFQIGTTFGLTTLAWIFFRAEDLSHALLYIKGLFSKTLILMPEFPGIGRSISLIILIIFLLVVEWSGRTSKFAISSTGKNWPRLLRWSFFSFIVFLIGMFMQTAETPFIYFQF